MLVSICTSKLWCFFCSLSGIVLACISAVLTRPPACLPADLLSAERSEPRRQEKTPAQVAGAALRLVDANNGYDVIRRSRLPADLAGRPMEA